MASIETEEIMLLDQETIVYEPLFIEIEEFLHHQTTQQQTIQMTTTSHFELNGEEEMMVIDDSAIEIDDNNNESTSMNIDENESKSNPQEPLVVPVFYHRLEKIDQICLLNLMDTFRQTLHS